MMYAFRVGTKENFDYDGDHGVGLHLLQHMRNNNIANKVIIVTRDCHADFAHIGKKRLDHAVEVGDSALDKISLPLLNSNH